jgi:hypothetical protein
MNLPTTIARNADASWTFSWTPVPGAQRYRVVLWGRQLNVQQSTGYTYQGLGFLSFPPPLEVVVSTDLALSEVHQPFMVVQWYGQACQGYLVEQGGQIVKEVVEDGSWVYTYQSPVLTDETSYTYNVLAEDAVGNLSPAVAYTQYIICPPVPPDGQVKVTYDTISGDAIIIAA